MSRIIELKSISAGTMYGPTSAVDGQLFRADGTSGTKVQLAPLVLINDSGQVSIGQLAAPCSLLELWDDDAHPILSITAAHATDYDPQIQFRTDATDTVKCSMGVDSGDSDKFKIYIGSGIGDTSQFVFTSAGFLGIGESAPETLIEMTHASPFMTFHCDTESDAADSGMCKLLFKRKQSGGEETAHAAIYAAHGGSGDDQRGYQAFYTNSGTDGNSPTERMRIDSNGNVSIGYALAANTIRLQVSDGTNVGTGWASQFDVFAVTGEDVNFAFVDTDNGTWGGGLGLKQVDGTVFENAWGIIRQTNGDGDGNGSLNFTYGTNASISSNGIKVTIDTNGNMGIAQPTPSQKLDVTGNINVTSTVFTDTLDSTHDVGTGLPTASDSNLILRDSTAVAAGVGGSIVFTGKYTGSTYLSGAPYMRASKESAVSGEYGFALTFGTRAHTQACSEKLRIMGNGNVGVGVTSPTAYLHIKAGTATASTAPVKLTNGTLLGTPEAGAIEYSLEKFWITNVSTQRVIDRSSCVITETTTVSNTTDETEIYNCPIAGNGLRAGNHVHVGVSGLISNDSAADDITIRLYIGSTLISTYNPAIGNITDADWHAEIQITTRSIGATGSVAVHGHVIIDDNEDHVISVETVDTTATCDLSITVEWDNAKATNIISAILGASHWSN